MKIPKSIHENKNNINTNLHNKSTKDNNNEYGNQSSNKCTGVVKKYKISVPVPNNYN